MPLQEDMPLQVGAGAHLTPQPPLEPVPVPAQPAANAAAAATARTVPTLVTIFITNFPLVNNYNAH